MLLNYLWRTSNNWEHSVIQRLKNILTLLWRGCSWLLCSKETCGWGIIHFFEADNIMDLSTWWRLSCWQRRWMKRHRKRQISRRSPLSSPSLQFPLPPYTLSFNHPKNFSCQQWHHSSKQTPIHVFMFSNYSFSSFMCFWFPWPHFSHNVLTLHI